MRIKSYFANTIREAINQARADLGADAMIIASRKTSADQRDRGEYEVVCGVAAEAPTPQPARSPAPAPVPPRPADLVSGFIGRIRSAAARKKTTAIDDVTSRLRTRPELGRPNTPHKVVALVGPPGAGKTTTLVKLALQYGTLAHKSVHIVSLDAYRIGGADALRAYASAINATFEAFDSPSALAELLDRNKSKGLLLIDTPPDAAPFAPVLARHRDVDVHLVLPATMALPDLEAAFTRYRACLPEKLIFTGTDMASSCAAAAALSVRSETPVSFLGTGPQVPEDLEPAERDKIASRIPAQLAASSAA